MNPRRNEAAEVLARHGRTFRWASAFLPREQAQDAATLYAFCRRADDLVDELPATEGYAAIAILRRQVGTGDIAVGDRTVSAFVELARRRDIDPVVVDTLLATLQADAGPVRFTDTAQLLRYAYGVASTVGLMMCDVLGCRDPRARAFAVDLGIAMQLTNVARDVLEDAGRDRVYVPLESSIEPADLLVGPGPVRTTAMRSVLRVLDLADRYYRSADRGLRFLPWRARCAILAASRIYQGIGAVIRQRGEAYWHERCYVSRLGKLRRTVRAVSTLLFVPRYWHWTVRSSAHDPELHASLRGLPYAEPA